MENYNLREESPAFHPIIYTDDCSIYYWKVLGNVNVAGALNPDSITFFTYYAYEKLHMILISEVSKIHWVNNFQPNPNAEKQTNVHARLKIIYIWKISFKKQEHISSVPAS